MSSSLNPLIALLPHHVDLSHYTIILNRVKKIHNIESDERERIRQLASREALLPEPQRSLHQTIMESYLSSTRLPPISAEDLDMNVNTIHSLRKRVKRHKKLLKKMKTHEWKSLRALKSRAEQDEAVWQSLRRRVMGIQATEETDTVHSSAASSSSTSSDIAPVHCANIHAKPKKKTVFFPAPSVRQLLSNSSNDSAARESAQSIDASSASLLLLMSSAPPTSIFDQNEVSVGGLSLRSYPNLSNEVESVDHEQLDHQRGQDECMEQEDNRLDSWPSEEEKKEGEQINNPASNSSSTNRRKKMKVRSIGIPGVLLPPLLQQRLKILRSRHKALTHLWNSRSDHLAPVAAGTSISTVNGEMTQADFTKLIATLMYHPNIPAYAQLQSSNCFFLDIGSGYGLATLHAAIQCNASSGSIFGGIEVARDRAYIGHRLTQHMNLSEQVHFVDADACHSDVRPILLAASHLFAYSAAFSDDTRNYLAEVIRDPQSCWLLCINFEPPSELIEAGVAVHFEPHSDDCTLGGVHILGELPKLAMSVSRQSHTAYMYMRCSTGEDARQAEIQKAGLRLLKHRSSETGMRANEDWRRVLNSSSPVLRQRSAAAV